MSIMGNKSTKTYILHSKHWSPDMGREQKKIFQTQIQQVIVGHNQLKKFHTIKIRIK